MKLVVSYNHLLWLLLLHLFSFYFWKLIMKIKLFGWGTKKINKTEKKRITIFNMTYHNVMYCYTIFLLVFCVWQYEGFTLICRGVCIMGAFVCLFAQICRYKHNSILVVCFFFSSSFSTFYNVANTQPNGNNTIIGHKVIISVYVYCRFICMRV